MNELLFYVIEEPSCRICLEEDDEYNFVTPCNCSGTMKYVHKNCLNKWRCSVIGIERYSTCGTCKGKYTMCKEDYEFYCEYVLHQRCYLICRSIIDVISVLTFLVLFCFICFCVFTIWSICMDIKDFYKKIELPRSLYY